MDAENDSDFERRALNLAREVHEHFHAGEAWEELDEEVRRVKLKVAREVQAWNEGKDWR